MARARPRGMSLAEFLEWDDGTDRRYELIDGEPIAMAPPLFGHAIVQGNLFQSIAGALKPPCRALLSTGVVPSEEASDRYFVPDIAITCVPVDPRGRYLTSPRVIIEILSPATSPHDRTVKLDGYREIASLEEMVFVHALERRVQLWRRAPDHWLVFDLIGDAELRLERLDVTVPLVAIYAGLELEDGPAAATPRGP